MRCSLWLLLFCVAWLGFASGTARAQSTILVSPCVAGNAGNGDNAFPFDIGSSLVQSMRYQQVYNAADFQTTMPQGGFITALRFDVAFAAGAPFDSVLPSIQINLSTTARPADRLSNWFADNVGDDDTVVFEKGPLALRDDAFGGADAIIPLPRPFFYNPSSGNLLLDVRNFGGGTTGLLNAN